MTPSERDAAIESALMQVADNVAKHFTGRGGWTADDACFRVDLREAKAALLMVVEQAVAAERERCAKLIEGFRTGGPAPETVSYWGEALATTIRKAPATAH